MNNKTAALKRRVILCGFVQGINTLLNLNNAFFDVNEKKAYSGFSVKKYAPQRRRVRRDRRIFNQELFTPHPSQECQKSQKRE
jgi:hypothetical protein